ncbi:MAG: hypothetical protein MUO63_03590 [Desulfobulbaceae bacterium]|nr:hypothetical protein [Desulfobulbaceae bacterium]
MAEYFFILNQFVKKQYVELVFPVNRLDDEVFDQVAFPGFSDQVLEDGCFSDPPWGGELQVFTVFNFAPDFFGDCRAGEIFFLPLGSASSRYPEGHTLPPWWWWQIIFCQILRGVGAKHK